MSQSLLAYTLPNGTQVLIPALDSKAIEILPMVLYGDRPTDPVVNDPTAASVLFPGIQVAYSDLDPMMDTSSPLESTGNEEEIVLRSSHVENDIADHPNEMKCVDKQNSLDNAVIINAQINEIVELSRSANSPIRSNNIVSEILFRTPPIDAKGYDSDEDSSVRLTSNGTQNCLDDLGSERLSSKFHTNNLESITIEEGGKCETIHLERVNINDIFKKYDPEGDPLKQMSHNGIPSEIDSFGSDYDSCDSGSQHGETDTNICMKASVKEIGVSKKGQNGVLLLNYIDKDEGNEKINQRAESVVTSSSDSILQQACTSVELSSETDEVEGHTNNAILDHLDEFAEMVMWFKCRLCKFTAGSKEELLDHLRMEHIEGNGDSESHSKIEKVDQHILKSEETVSEKLVFLCGQCSAGFNSIEACKAHMMQIHELIVQENEAETESHEQEEENDEIPNSDKKNSCNDGKKNVINRKHTPATLPFKCSVRGCQSKFSEMKDVGIHKSCHADSENSHDFRCCECQTPFERWRTCAMHLWKVHNIDCGLLTCPICMKYKTATSVSLENHMRIHGEARSFTCPECGKGFKQSAQLNNHRVMHLDRKTSELPRWYATKQCNICFKNYADSKCLKKHVQAVHSKLRPYVCQVCGHASARKAMLQLHYRQHTGEKPHSCPLCDYRTGDHNSLRRHIMRHTGQRPYRCPHCPYSAIQSNSYKNHLHNKHPGQSGVFSCSQCTFKTVSHEGYLLHVSDHKNVIISSNYDDDSGNDVEVFPGNVAAAQLIYQCLNALSSDGTTVEANVTGSSTSADGTTQTITIQIPNQECSNNNENEDDDDVARCFLEVKQQVGENVDIVGGNIPSETEHNALRHMVS